MAKKRPSPNARARSKTGNTGPGRRRSDENSSQPSKGFAEKSETFGTQDLPPPPDASFVPRGPTLRTEYEKKGFITPSNSPDAGTLPEVVANRMLRRMLTFGGLPLSFLFVFFVVYFVLKFKYDITVLPVVVATSTLGTIGLATLGITYGIFSSSWDEDEEGSTFGWSEAKKNFVRARDGILGARQREMEEEEFDKLDSIAKERTKEDQET